MPNGVVKTGRPSRAAPRDSSEMDGAAVAVLSSVVVCSVGYTVMRLGAMEQRTEGRLGAMEKRTEERLGTMEQRISAVELLHQQKERRHDPASFQDLVDHTFAGKHSNAALFALSESVLDDLLQEHSVRAPRSARMLVEAARSRRQALTWVADSEGATDAECEAAEVSASVFWEGLWRV